MKIDLVNLGSCPNSGDGDTIRDSFKKYNANFVKLSRLINSINPGRCTWRYRLGSLFGLTSRICRFIERELKGYKNV